MQPRELTIKTRHLTFAALELGDPLGKPVLALHGWLDNAASFIPVASELQGVRVIAIDLAGHGLSDHRPVGWSYDIWHYVEDLVDIVEALGLSSFGLMGHSMGAIISTLSAATVLKQQVTAMVLIDGLTPSPRLPEDAPESLTRYIQQRRTPAEALSVSRYRSQKMAIRARAIGFYTVSRRSAELLVSRGLRQQGDGWQWTADPRLKLASPVRFTHGECLAFIRNIKCPADVIYAEGGEISHFINEYQVEMPNMQFHALSGSHHLHMDGQVSAVANIAHAACF